MGCDWTSWQFRLCVSKVVIHTLCIYKVQSCHSTIPLLHNSLLSGCIITLVIIGSSIDSNIFVFLLHAHNYVCVSGENVWYCIVVVKVEGLGVLFSGMYFLIFTSCILSTLTVEQLVCSLVFDSCDYCWRAMGLDFPVFVYPGVFLVNIVPSYPSFPHSILAYLLSLKLCLGLPAPLSLCLLMKQSILNFPVSFYWPTVKELNLGLSFPTQENILVVLSHPSPFVLSHLKQMSIIL